jgi:hypothetical protein
MPDTIPKMIPAFLASRWPYTVTLNTVPGQLQVDA